MDKPTNQTTTETKQTTSIGTKVTVGFVAGALLAAAGFLAFGFGKTSTPTTTETKVEAEPRILVQDPSNLDVETSKGTYVISELVKKDPNTECNIDINAVKEEIESNSEFPSLSTTGSNTEDADRIVITMDVMWTTIRTPFGDVRACIPGGSDCGYIILNPH